MIKYILMDVEGTTTSINFVHQVLFPYAKLNLLNFLDKYEELCLEELAQVSLEANQKLTNTQAAKILETYIEQDIKHTALKSLQGKIWKIGYESGEIKGHVYNDVLPAFKKWKSDGITLGIYSSGSVLAQKLIFGHSEAGDLTHYLSNHFDTNIGHKREVQSYINIAHKLGLNPSEVLFLSDIAEECEAAQKAGLQVSQLIRDDETIKDERFIGYKNFLEIKIKAE